MFLELGLDSGETAKEATAMEFFWPNLRLRSTVSGHPHRCREYKKYPSCDSYGRTHMLSHDETEKVAVITRLQNVS